MTYHPWRELRGRPEIDVQWAALPLDVSALVEGTSITIDSRLTQVQRRCSLLHELLHVERGVPHGVDEREESLVEQEVARRLVPLEQLVDALRWSRHPREVADHCWVTVDVILTRAEHLHPSERHYLRRALADDEGETA